MLSEDPQDATPDIRIQKLEEENSRLRAELVRLREITGQTPENHFSSFRTLAENIPDNITRVDRDLNYLYVNAGFAKNIGIPAEHLIGQSSVSYFPESEITRKWADARRQVLETGKPLSMEFSVKLDEAGIKTFHALIVPEFNVSGEVETVLSVSREITDQVSIRERLRESEAFIRRITDIAPYLIFVYDSAKQQIVFSNPVADEYLRHMNIEADNTNRLALRSLFHPDDMPKIDEQLAQDFGQEGKLLSVLRCRLRHEDGEWRWVQMWLAIFQQNPIGQTSQLLGLAQDITEQMQAEEQTFRLAIEEERLRILTDFIHAVSHEFRTPLASISMTIYLLERVLPPEHSRYIERLQNANVQITDLVEALLQLTTLDSIVELDTEELDITHSLSQAITSLTPVAAQKQITLDSLVAENLPMVRGNAKHLLTAFTHLIDNAIRYSNEMGQVRVVVSCDDQMVKIMIQDSGVGIHPDMQQRVFERFYRLDEARSTRGLGLGLPIAQRIIELHGGTIELASTPGEGSTFTVVLPALS